MWSKARLLALFSVLLYTFDTSSDTVVGVDLIRKCHLRYGISVFLFVLLPGFIYGWFDYFFEARQDEGKIYILKAITGPLWFIPYAFWKLCRAVINEDDHDTLFDAKV